ncbi:uncharacterized protein [Porites lutea]|uniref:uncharacterized protein n=1 Tax=Porites lutea TaxID=51062 RepID=UPI003CC5A101
MAEGGQPLTDEVDSDQTEEFLMLPFTVPPLLAQLKMQGDERFRAHDYEKAAHLYLMALNYPVPLFMADVPAVSEQLFRRRAVCLYKMPLPLLNVLKANTWWIPFSLR